MKIEVHFLCFREVEILTYTIRHYKTFATRIVMHDLGSDDGSIELAESMGIEVKRHDCKKEFDDAMNKRLKQEEWKGTDADWVICADADELLFFPIGAEATLAAHKAAGTPIIKPYGYEMFSEVYPTGSGQIYDEVKMGARDDKWYAKPILFQPALCQHVEFSAGAHEAFATLKTGQKLPNPTTFSSPPCYLLHYHHIGSLQRIADEYDAHRARHSENNKRNHFGNMKPGLIHAQEKRDLILPRLERVIA